MAADCPQPKIKYGRKLIILKKTFIWSLLVALPIALSGGLAQGSTVTIATFADPSMDASNPLFTIDLVNDHIMGGWADSQTNLTLEVIYSGNTFVDAFFTMTTITYAGDITGGETGGGTIKFFANGQSTSTTPLIQIGFDSGHVTPLGFGAMDLFYADGVNISGSEIGPAILTDEAFSFSFTNQVPIGGDWNNGHTATASFTSSAIPEPATIALLGLGALSLLRRKRRAKCN